MRLQKYLARAGIASRRASESIIAQGRVCVNGRVIDEPGRVVDEVADEVMLDGEVVRLPQDTVVLMLNKPAGYVTTMHDPQGRKNVSDLVPADAYPGLFPVGRLDADTTGLLLFTNDGELGNRLLHPSHHVPKTYIAHVEGIPNAPDLERLRSGVQLEDGLTVPAQAELVSADRKADAAVVRLTIHEGKKRQVKRMLAAVGHPVTMLERVRFGALDLGELERGRTRLLTEDEVAGLSSSG